MKRGTVIRAERGPTQASSGNRQLGHVCGAGTYASQIGMIRSPPAARPVRKLQRGARNVLLRTLIVLSFVAASFAQTCPICAAGKYRAVNILTNVALNKPVTASTDFLKCGGENNCAGFPGAYDSSGSGLPLAGNPVTNGDGQLSGWHAADNDNTNFLILDLGQDFSAIESMVTTKNSGHEWFGWKRVTIEIKNGSESSWQPVRTDSTSYRFSNYENYQVLIQVDQLYIQLLYEITAYLYIHMCFL
jgi:hypothetical protein